MTQQVNILVADDLPTQQLAIEVALAELGEHVVSVGSGRDALKYLLENDAAVILLDVNMPEMDGFETAALIRQRQRTAHTPIIFLTADTDEVQALRGYALGAVDYLFCPFLPEVLRTKVKVFVELSRIQERIRREAEQRIELSREQAARAAAEEQGRRLRFQAETSALLNRSFEGEPFARELLALFVPRIADVAALIPGNAGESTWVGGGGEDRDHAAAAPELDEALTRCIGTGETITIPGAGGEAGGVAGIAVPLAVRGISHGALGAILRESGRRYATDQLEMIKLVANRTAVALDNLQLYDQLRDRDRRKDEFLAMLSHELRNPLGAIATAAHLLDLVGTREERGMHARDVIKRQTLHLTRIIDDLLEVSRVTSGHIALELGPVNLREIVDRAVDALRASGRLTEHHLTVQGEPLVVEADGARMEQVVTNLLVNAFKYTDRDGDVSVEVRAEGDDAVIQVTDSGIGISPELLPRVFDVFVQGKQTLDRAEGGLGLGLALVRRLVELQGGSVHATSEGIGHGSTFSVRLPRLLAVRPAAPDHRPSASPVPIRVLTVDDHEDLRATLRLLLEYAGHEVHEAATGPEAIEVAARVEPHLVFIDLGLPGFDGYEVARRLREANSIPGLTLVALTGYGRVDDRRRTARAGFDAHLVKPVTAADLSHIVEVAARRLADETGGAAGDGHSESHPPAERAGLV